MTASGTTTYTANFTTQYLLTTSVNPSGGGSVTPSGTTWQESGQPVQLTATASAGYTFTGWTGSYTSTQNPLTITMDGPKNIVANFGPPSQEGTQKWAFPTGASIPSSPAIAADGTIYVGSGDHALYVINPNGTQKWAFPTGDWIESSPAIGADGTIYVGSCDHSLYAINPNGSQKWAFPTGDWIFSSPSIGADGTIYVGSWDSNLYAINPDGSQKWAFPTGGYIESSPAIAADGTIYVGSNDGNLYAINPNGSQKWAWPSGASTYSSPAIAADGTIYVGSWDSNLYAINPNGSQKWAFPTGALIHSSPAIAADGTIYVGSNDGNLYAINPNGSQKWAFQTGNSWIRSTPAISADGTIYVGSNDGNLYAINPNGSQKWAFQTGGSIISSPAIGADGTIYIGSYDGFLYAITSSSPGLADSPWPMFHRDLQHTGRVPSASGQLTLEATYSTDVKNTGVKYYHDGNDWVGRSSSGILRAANSWDISGIDPSWTITSVEVRYYVEAKTGSPGALSLTRYGTSHGEDNPQTDTGAPAYSKINGTAYASLPEPSSGSWTGWVSLGSTAIADILWCRDNGKPPGR